MDELQRETKKEIDEIFKDFLFREKDADYIYIGQYNPKSKDKFDVLLEHGEGNARTNVFSCTKSLVGLYIAMDYLVNNIPIDVPFLEMLECLEENLPKDFSLLGNKSLITYLNHVSGIVTGATKPRQDGIGELWNGYVPSNIETPYTLINRGIWYDLSKLSEKEKTHPFEYNNYSIQIAGMLYELYIRCLKKVDISHPEKLFTLRKACLDTFFPKTKDYIIWPSRSKEDLVEHSSAFSGVQLTGHEMRDFAKDLFTRFRPVLAFIGGLPYVSHNGCVMENKFIVEANDNNVDPGFKTAHHYKYSFGWWMPQIEKANSKSKKMYLSAQGMIGQRILVDVEKGFVVVRKKNHTYLDVGKAFFDSLIHGTSPNHHLGLNWHVSLYQDAIEEIMNMKDHENRKWQAAFIVSEFRKRLKEY